MTEYSWRSSKYQNLALSAKFWYLEELQLYSVMYWISLNFNLEILFYCADGQRGGATAGGGPHTVPGAAARVRTEGQQPRPWLLTPEDMIQVGILSLTTHITVSSRCARMTFCRWISRIRAKFSEKVSRARQPPLSTSVWNLYNL